MKIHVKEAKVYQLFEVTLVLKAIHSVMEIISGALLALVSSDTVLRIATFVTQGEILEDPKDAVANYLLRLAHDLSVSRKTAAALFLLSHGAVKLVLVLAVMRGRPWAYPAFMVALSLLIGYQSYQLSQRFSGGLTALTALDGLVLVLTWHEYRLVRTPR